jgi:hypothetical protein
LTYDKTIEVLHNAINRSAIDRSEKVNAFKRLQALDSGLRACEDLKSEA